MKRKIIIACVSVLAVFVLLIAGLVGWFIYADNYQLSDRGRSSSPDGRYEVVFHQVGSPQWPFGSVDVRATLRIKESKKKIEVIETSIRNDGVPFYEQDWSVVWQDESVEITLRGSEQEDAVYLVPLQ